MGFIPKVEMVTTPWTRHFKDVRFLFICFLLVISDAAVLLDFPGPYTCLDDGIQVTKPVSMSLNSWKSLHIVDPNGGKVEACDFHPNESNVTIPWTCINYEAGRKNTYVSFIKWSITNLVYKIACRDYQADSDYQAYSGPVTECGTDSMMVKISRTLSGFSDESVVGPPISTWMVVIYNGTQKTKVNVTTAKIYGYVISSDNDHFMIQIDYDALGIQMLPADGTRFYHGNIDLILEKLSPKITIEVKIICARGPFLCNESHMKISIPPVNGSLQFIDIDNVAIQIPNDAALQEHGLTIDTSSGTKITIKKDKLQVVPSNPKELYLPPLTLIFAVNDFDVAMLLTGKCYDWIPDDPGCSKDGFMTVEVVSLQTRPSLNLDTVILGNGQCRPQKKTDEKITFIFPLTDCGTKMMSVGGTIVYENEVRALWKDYPRKISRDSELRETVRCRYNVSEGVSFHMTVLTPSPPPVSERYDGPISFVLNLYQDDSYVELYKDDQYPVVKTLRDPIYLEVQVLNRNDVNIELVLNDCWATMSPDPTASPQWNIVVDGCEEGKDDYLTVFHQVSNVELPNHRKRFEVKAFAFIMGDDVSTNFVFFHCSALICSMKSPDYPLCMKSCPGSRKKRDELFLNRHSVLASLPGPLLLVDSDPAMVLQDEHSVIKQITLGVLPAFGIVAAIVLAVVLVSTVKQKAKL